MTSSNKDYVINLNSSQAEQSLGESRGSNVTTSISETATSKVSTNSSSSSSLSSIQKRLREVSTPHLRKLKDLLEKWSFDDVARASKEGLGEDRIERIMRMACSALQFIPKLELSFPTPSSRPTTSETTLEVDVKMIIFGDKGTGMVLFVLLMKRLGAFADATTSVLVNSDVKSVNTGKDLWCVDISGSRPDVECYKNDLAFLLRVSTKVDNEHTIKAIRGAC